MTASAACRKPGVRLVNRWKREKHCEHKHSRPYAFAWTVDTICRLPTALPTLALFRIIDPDYHASLLLLEFQFKID
jgi:hypothetical protein